ncbi:M3 family peptidase [Palleniella muris]|uniref:M3 family peptidase n=1 Tax=Palleniella muris TaxID=3038145 RepID=A0AC61QRV8_9BACT|nr:M3 family metallopeptidase [Palleniella muris]TGX83027.1 M3 family peptidase [Palleniella muris]
MLNDKNPLLRHYNTPHETAPFGEISIQDFEEAMLEGIRRDNEDIDLIVNNPAEPTFDNTIVREDSDREKSYYYGLLGRATTIFFNLMSAETSDEIDALAEKMQPILTKHSNDVSLNKQLFERIKRVHDRYACENNDGLRPLSAEERMLLDKSYDGFVRSGALLNEEEKDKLRALSEEASMLALKFSQNLLKENKAYSLHITDEAQLEGLPQTATDTAAQTAKEQEKEGWVFTLDMPSYSPFMTYSTQRELRREMYMARNSVCTHDNDENNLEICKRLVNLRREIAQLLGYETYADYVLKHRMATSVANVYNLLDSLIEAYKPTAEQERKELREFAGMELEPWDVSFYSHKLQLERYNLDSEMLRPYFKLENVINGIFGLATRLYGITFKENNDIPVYHPDVKAYEVFDKDGSYLAVFYADFHPRKGKQGGAWMTEYQGQWIDCKGENVRPHVSVVMNLTKPTAEKPALLTLGEVETFLHEFGHSLHGMFANTRFESLSGTNVWWDFVELPSQFMENFSVEREFLRTFAFHYETGEVIPDELIDRILKARNYNCATACLRQVSFGLLDMAYYTKKDEFSDDIVSFEKKAWEKAILGKQRNDTCMTVQFSHIMAGGYAAGYYSYKWAEVLDADAFAVFQKEGIFNPETAQRFRDCILSKGGTEHPMELYKRFKGSEATIDALLERNGIKTTAS